LYKNVLGYGWLSRKLGVHVCGVCLPWQLSGFESRHLSKLHNGWHKQRSGQHTLVCQKNIQKSTSGDVLWVVRVYSVARLCWTTSSPLRHTFLPLHGFPPCTVYFNILSPPVYISFYTWTSTMCVPT
jgi:hypothetical protein